MNKDTSWGYKTIITPASATRQFAKEPLIYPLWSCSKRLVSYHMPIKLTIQAVFSSSNILSPFPLFTLSALNIFPPFHLFPLSSFHLFPFHFFPFSPFHLFPLSTLSSFPLSTFPSFHFFTLSPLSTLSPFIAWLGLKLFIRNNVPSCQN